MKLVIEIPEQMYLNAKADILCGADILVSAIKDGTPHETVTEFADRCRECGREKVLDQIRAEIETEKNAGCHTWYAGGLDFAISIIDKYKAERSGTDAKEKINPYKKCKTCGQDKASCCGCPEVLELERRIRKEHKEC